MDPVYFPPLLREYFLSQSGENDVVSLTNLFQENESVRDTFITWTQDHQEIVERTPRLYQALDLANNSDVEWQGVAKNVNSIYLAVSGIMSWLKQEPQESFSNIINSLNNSGEIKQEYIDECARQGFPNFSLRVLELSESGIINNQQVIQLFSIKISIWDTTPLHVQENFVKALPFLEKLPFEILISLLSYKANKLGMTLLHDPRIFKLALPLLIKMPLDILTSLVSIKESTGDTALSLALPLFKNMPAENIAQLFSIKNENGDTLLHNSAIFKLARPFLHMLPPEVLNIRNNLGLTPRETNKISISKNWILKDKQPVSQKSLTEEEYGKRAAALKQNIDTLWESFVFRDGEENIPPEYLTIDISGEKKTCTPQEIKENLDIMVAKILNKEAWIGTPPADQPEQLLKFYSQMVLNLEKIVSQGSQKSPAEMAGYLIGISKTQFEGRCAAAYQSEIEQTAMLLNASKEEVGMEARFTKMASASLTDTIEKFVRQEYGGDSHAFSQMLYYTGLSLAPDHLSRITLEDAQNKVIEHWTAAKVISDLTESFHRLDPEELELWFNDKIPDTFGPEFTNKIDALRSKEQKIVQNSKTTLQERGINNKRADSIMEVLQSTQGMRLSSHLPERKFVSEEVFDQMIKAFTSADVLKAEDLHTTQNSQAKQKRIGLLEEKDQLLDKQEALNEGEQQRLNEINAEIRTLQQKNMGITSEFNDLKRYATARKQLKEIIDSSKSGQPPLSPEELDIIMEEKAVFDTKIRQLAKDEDVDFSPHETGLPSAGQVLLRRAAYSEQFFSQTEKGMKLNVRGVIDILLHIGLLEKESSPQALEETLLD